MRRPRFARPRARAWRSSEHQHQQERGEDVRQILVCATGLQRPGGAGPAVQQAKRRSIQPVLEDRSGRVLIFDALDEETRFWMELDVEPFRGAVEEVEHALERVRERGGGVLHPRRLHDTTAAPRLAGPCPARGTDEPERHEWGEEQAGEDDADRRRRNTRELARYADRQPVSTDGV